MKNESENIIWESFLKGSRTAFEQLYNVYAPMLFNYGFTITTDANLLQDTIQDFFIDLWKRKTNLNTPDNLKSYLVIAFRNRLFKTLKKNPKFEAEQTESLETAPSPETVWILEIENELRNQKLKSALQSLPDRQKEALHLKYFNGMSSKEIAEVLEMNVQSVSNILYRALTALRKKF